MRAQSIADLDETTSARPVTRTLTIALAVLAGLCWAGALAVLFLADVSMQQQVFAPSRVLFYALVIAAALLTWVPMQVRLDTPGLALEGLVGSFLLLYTIAFVPAPKSWLLSPPDAPVYALLAGALYLTGTAIALPFVAAIGSHFFRQRARRFDKRRTRRQARECGLALALLVVLAGLRVLTPLGVLLVVMILVVAELMFLSFVEAET